MRRLQNALDDPKIKKIKKQDGAKGAWQSRIGTEGGKESMVGTAFDKALHNTSEIEITTIGRTTGRRISRPVWFVRRGDTLYLLPIRGSDSNWYRNLLQDSTIRLAAGKAEITSSATPITDPGKVEEVVDAFRAKYGAREVKADYPKTDAAVEVHMA